MRVLREVWWLLLSGVGAAVLIGVGSLALFATPYPKWVSLTMEPLSLLLMPGVAASMLFTKAHDYTWQEILQGAFVFFSVVVWVLLRWWDGRRGLAQE